MAKDLLIQDGKLVFTDDGDLQFVEGLEEMAQSLRIELSTQEGTHVEVESFGFPFLDLVMKKNPNSSLIASVAKAKILARPDVLSAGPVFSELDPVTRTHRLSFEVRTTQGLLSATVEI